MFARNIRLRKEYLYMKNLEGEERRLYEKKRKIREALQEGKPIPTELRNEEAKLREEIDLEDQNTSVVPGSHIDDEYAKATEKDPKILMTTSRDPSAPLTRFELKNVFPNAKRMNRVSQVQRFERVDESFLRLLRWRVSHDYSDVIFVTENRGRPDGLIVSHLPFGPTAYFQLLNVVTRYDIQSKKANGKMSEQYPYMGKRVGSMLKHMFPVPKTGCKTYSYFPRRRAKSIELKEVGPRFELRLYQVKLGKQWNKRKQRWNGFLDPT
ncbi:Ribosomal RNA processing Brix domain protein [Raphanus sativus]|nr:Ribosomal RNA processing Brix domain protein [Raphanus sativus]